MIILSHNLCTIPICMKSMWRLNIIIQSNLSSCVFRWQHGAQSQLCVCVCVYMYVLVMKLDKAPVILGKTQKHTHNLQGRGLWWGWAVFTPQSCLLKPALPVTLNSTDSPNSSNSSENGHKLWKMQWNAGWNAGFGSCLVAQHINVCFQETSWTHSVISAFPYLPSVTSVTPAS